MTTLLLVGRSGNGKSSVGNAILGTNSFRIMSNHQSDGWEQLYNEAFKNAGVQVVDSTGIGDTGSDMVSDVKSVIRTAQEAVELCNPGFDALVLVLKYGVRFTKQEKDAVQMVKSIFGENVFRDWGILVFSYGDNFYLDTEDDKKTFEEWCREQTGDIRDLFVDVDYRCVIFDKKSHDLGTQRQQLIQCVEKIRESKRVCYSMSDFEEAKQGREKLIVREEYESLRRETDELIRKTNHSLKLKRGDEEYDQLENLLLELKGHANKLNEKDRNTGILKLMKAHVREQVTKIKDMLHLLKQKEMEASTPDICLKEFNLAWQHEPKRLLLQSASFFLKSLLE